MTTGQFLRNARVKAGLSQSDVAVKLKFQTSQFVSNWERDICMVPPRHARTVSHLYKIDFERLKAKMKKDLVSNFESKF